MAPKQLISARGDQFVLVPLAEYEGIINAVRELAAAIAISDTPGEADDSGPLLVTGESRLRAWRKHRGLTCGELGAAIGVAQSYISRLETGRSQGKLTIWSKLAKALNTEMEAILPEDL